MAFIGNTPTQQAFTPAVDFFNGDGSTTAFTLSKPVASVAQVQAVISNVPQTPGTAYTVSGNTITFTSAPPSGTNNIYVYYTSPITQVIAPGQGTVGADQLQSSINITTLSTTNGATIQGLTVGRGAGAVSTNTAVGASALAANTTGSNNTALGSSAFTSNTEGSSSTAVGSLALTLNTTGSANTGIGQNSLGNNISGSDNTAVGTASMLTNSTGVSNAALGRSALRLNTTGSYNTVIGMDALRSNTTASYNTAVGYQAGYSNTTGTITAFGYKAGYSATTVVGGVYVGDQAGQVATGAANTFVGSGAGFFVTSGAKNTILGGYGGNSGGLDIRTASNNIVLADGDGNPKLYYQASNTRWILQDQFWPTGLRSGAGTNTAKYNTGTGELTYDTSSARYKDNIRDSIYGLSHVMQMRSAQFEYKDDGRSDVGLIAEELQPIIPELVGVNKEGQADSVSYDRMVSVLVKAIQELKAEFDAYKEAHP